MMDMYTLTCPTCGGKLQITPEINSFLCTYCGNEHIVKRSGGIISIQPVVEGLKNIQRGTDKTASELAIKRIQEELSGLNSAKLATGKRIMLIQSDLDQFQTKNRLMRTVKIVGAAALFFSLAGPFLIPVYQRDPVSPIIALSCIGIFLAWLTASSTLLNSLRSLGRLPSLPSLANLLSEQKLKQDEVRKLNDSILAKEKELSRHQEIVSQIN